MIIYEYCILDGVIPYDEIPIKEFVAVAIPVTVIYICCLGQYWDYLCHDLPGFQLYVQK